MLLFENPMQYTLFDMSYVFSQRALILLSHFQSYVHRAYTESLLNPFSDINAKITSERFVTKVNRLVTGFNQL